MSCVAVPSGESGLLVDSYRTREKDESYQQSQYTVKHTHTCTCAYTHTHAHTHTHTHTYTHIPRRPKILERYRAGRILTGRVGSRSTRRMVCVRIPIFVSSPHNLKSSERRTTVGREGGGGRGEGRKDISQSKPRPLYMCTHLVPEGRAWAS